MGKKIAKKIRGMNLWAKVSLVTAVTLLFSVFMYEGWYKPMHSLAATVVKTYVYTTTAESWVGNSGTNGTDAAVTTGGNPTGAIQSNIAGRNRADATAGWLISGITWESLGVPTGSVVTSVNASYDWRCSLFTTGTTSESGDFTLTDAADGNGTTLVSGTTFVATTTWATRSATGIAIPAALQASNTPIKLKLLGNLATGNSSSASVTRMMDNVSLTITYAAVVNPTVSSASPNNQTQGTGPTDVTITGTGFQTGAVVTFSGTGVTAGASTFNSSSSITVPVTVTAGAATGARTITVTNTDTGTGSGGTFTVNSGIVNPAVTSATPNNQTQGTGPTDVTITGTAFQTGAVVTFSGTGVTAGASTFNSSSSITVPVTVTAGAATGARTITVTNTDTGTGTGGSFTINAAVVVNDTTASALTFSDVTHNTIVVTAPFTGDTNTNNSCVIKWGTVNGTYPNTATSSKSGNSYVATVNGLSGTTTYYFQATFTDPESVTGSPVTGSQATIAFVSPLMHNSANLGTGKGTWGTAFTCATCHNPNTTNVKLVALIVNTPLGQRNVVFNRMTANRTAGNGVIGVFGNDARTYALNASTNVCSVCHHNTTHHQYSSAKSSSPNHYNNQDCITCHLHSAAFAKPAGASHASVYPGATHMVGLTAGSYDTCTGCHSIVASGAYPATPLGDPPNCTGCHLDATNFNSASAGCADCHGTNANGRPIGTTFPDIVGSHSATGHVSLTCANCHNGAGSGTANHGSQNRIAKVRADVTVAFTGTGSWASGALTCSATYCHSRVQSVNGTAAGVSDTTPAWGSGTAACATNCHGNTVARLTTGKHTQHLATTHGTYTCDDCHTGAGQGTPAMHANSQINVAMSATYGGTYSDPNGAPANGFGTCSTVYCHSSVQSATGGTPPAYITPSWSGAATTCASCHGNNAATLTTGSHAAHLNATYTCVDCHGAAGGAGNTAIHVNKTINVVVTNHGASPTYSGDTIPQNSNFGTCGATFCHGATSPTWGGNTTNVTCTKCHGKKVQTAYSSANNWQSAPGYGGTGTDLGGATAGTDKEVGAHDRHLRALSNYSKRITCPECHTVPANAATALHIDTATPAEVPMNGTLARANSAVPAYVTGTSTCTATYCHFGKSIGLYSPVTANAAVVWTNTAYLTGTPSLAGDCGKCHASPPATTGNHTGVNNINQCNTCHSHVNTNGTFATPSLHINGLVESSSKCIDCHASIQTGTHGTPRDAVKGEFALTWGHKKSGRTAVTDADCIVCHLEGSFATQKTSGVHMDGKIDLRDPDGAGEVAITNNSGAAFTFTKFALDLTTARTSAITNSVADVVTQKFCLKCHDAGGAANTTARAGTSPTANAPFGGGFTALNTAAQFAITNSSRHPVLSGLNKDYPTAARMAVPFKPTGTRGTSGTKSVGVVMNCFDCHNTPTTPLTTRTVSAHGNNITLRGTINVSQPTLCAICHIGTGYVGSSNGGHYAGSAFATVDNHMDSSQLDLCANCHASSATATRPTRALDVHGVNVLPAGTQTKAKRWGIAGAVPIAFIRNNDKLANHQPKNIGGVTTWGGAAGAQCDMNGCASRTGCVYTTGGTY